MNIAEYVDFHKMWKDALKSHNKYFDDLEEYIDLFEPDFDAEEMYRMFSEVSKIEDVELNSNVESAEYWYIDNKIYFEWSIGGDDYLGEGGYQEGWSYSWIFTFDLGEDCFTHYESK